MYCIKRIEKVIFCGENLKGIEVLCFLLLFFKHIHSSFYQVVTYHVRLF